MANEEITYKIQIDSGALAFYNKVKSVSKHTNTFTSCGINTVSGNADLDQIPTAWGGNA